MVVCAGSAVTLRYTGAACDMCQASFWPTVSRICIPQWISGKNIFDPIETEPALSAWAIALIVIAALIAAAIMVGMAFTLYNWLVRGVPPKTTLSKAQHKVQGWWSVHVVARCRALLRRGRSPAAKPGAVSKKYLLGDGVELTAGGGLKSKGQAAWSDSGYSQVRL